MPDKTCPAKRLLIYKMKAAKAKVRYHKAVMEFRGGVLLPEERRGKMAIAETVCKMGYCGGSKATKTYSVKETMVSPERDIPCCDYCWSMAAAEAMWDFLVNGDPPNGFILPKWEPLKPRQAMTIIYVLQEFLGALPDTWEMCESCERFFNTGFECYVADEEHGILCEWCMPEEEGH